MIVNFCENELLSFLAIISSSTVVELQFTVYCSSFFRLLHCGEIAISADALEVLFRLSVLFLRPSRLTEKVFLVIVHDNLGQQRPHVAMEAWHMAAVLVSILSHVALVVTLTVLQLSAIPFVLSVTGIDIACERGL